MCVGGGGSGASYKQADPAPTTVTPSQVANGDESADAAVATEKKKKKGFSSTNTSNSILSSAVSEGKKTLG